MLPPTDLLIAALAAAEMKTLRRLLKCARRASHVRKNGQRGDVIVNSSTELHYLYLVAVY